MATRFLSRARCTCCCWPRHSPFAALLLITLALLGWLGFQTQQLILERSVLRAALQAQQPTVDNSVRLRATLDALAADTQRSADAGNSNARLLIEELRQSGITINAAATSAASSAPR